MTKRLFDVTAGLTAGLAAVLVFVNPLTYLHSQQIYVSPTGSDASVFADRSRPLRSIGTAIGRSRPGDEIILLPGVYHEAVTLNRNGMPGQPLTLRAETPGAATITNAINADDVRKWSWRAEGDGVWSALTPWPIYMLRADGAQLFRLPWGDPSKLRELAQRPGAWGIYCQPTGGRLYLRLRDGKDPRTAVVETHRQLPVPREWGSHKSTNLQVQADHLVIEGLCFDFGVGSGILLWDAHDVVIRDCQFTGAAYGINGSVGRRLATGLTVERNFYHHYPLGKWGGVGGWLDGKEIYSSYSAFGLLTSQGDDVVVRGNVIAQAADGLMVTNHPRPDGLSTKGVTLEKNVIACATDDAFELDGPAVNMRVAGNLIWDVHESFGLSPVDQGPVVIAQNCCFHPPAGLNGAQIKFASYEHFSGVIQRIDLQHNRGIGHYFCWWGKEKFNDVRLTSNWFRVGRLDPRRWPDAIQMENNRIDIIDWDTSLSADQRREWFASLLTPTALPTVETISVGAVPTDAWSMPRPGPRWLDPQSLPWLADLWSEWAPAFVAEAQP